MPTPDATELLDRRADLLRAGPSPELDDLTAQLRERLAGAEPTIRRVTAEEPGDLLERLARGERVHPVDGPTDLADRLDDDRRCFVLEHPALPGRPGNVVWVALWKGIADDVAEILDPASPTADPHAADTAVFYSIWAVEPGLAGIPGGRQLLVGAVEQLRSELPGLRTFITLSPVPGFRAWHEERHGNAPLPPDRQLLARCARYLTSFDHRGRPVDGVARFHLRNGARLAALQRHGDTSDRGIERSYGIMANYRYEPEDRASNREQLDRGEVPTGPAVAGLLAEDHPIEDRTIKDR